VKHTFSIESPLEDITEVRSSKAASELALCKRTTFCTASIWDIYKALRDVTFFLKSTTAYSKQEEWEDLEIKYKKKRTNMGETWILINWMRPWKKTTYKTTILDSLCTHLIMNVQERMTELLHTFQMFILFRQWRCNSVAKRTNLLSELHLVIVYYSSVIRVQLIFSTYKLTER